MKTSRHRNLLRVIAFAEAKHKEAKTLSEETCFEIIAWELEQSLNRLLKQAEASAKARAKRKV